MLANRKQPKAVEELKQTTINALFMLGAILCITHIDNGGSGAPIGSLNSPTGAPEPQSQNASLSMCVRLPGLP